MAQIITFPGTTPPAPMPARKPSTKAAAPTEFAKVVNITRRGRVPTANSEADQHTATIARIASGWADRAYRLAQTEPGSEAHKTALHMTRIDHQLPCNNLRIFTTPDDIVEGLCRARQRVDLAQAEWHLADLKRMDAYHAGDRIGEDEWKAKEASAEKRLWLEYERLVRIPATSLTEFNERKLGRWGCGVGSLEWMRTHKPDLAAVLDEELARLTVARDVKRAGRDAKRKGSDND